MVNVNQRPPVVTVLGHVDHGKTSLLDKIRNTSVQVKEAGGITQKIGASVVENNGKKITFIDTPGHSAFANMRKQGAKIADIVVLVISATDGVMPQTKEAIDYIKSLNIPFIVAATKVDLQSASVEKITGDLEKLGILLEEKGGDIPVIPVSVKTSVGIKELLDMILLMAELNDIKADPVAGLEAYVFETGKDRRGLFASVIVKNGNLSAGDEIEVSSEVFKARGIFDDLGRQTKEIKPGFPCQIIGFSTQLSVGDKITEKGKQNNPLVASKINPVVSVEKGEIGMFVKAASAGSLEALIANLPKGTKVVASGVGDVSESDVFNAKSMAVDIYLFETKAGSSIKKLAEAEGVKIYSYDIIYHMFEDIEKRIKEGIVLEKGKALILMSFPFNNQIVAGCKVVSGAISLNDNLILLRNEKEIGKSKAVSLKKNKTDVNLVKQGEEFGVILSPRLEFAIGDMLLSLQ